MSFGLSVDKSLLNKATLNSDEPTPGFLYEMCTKSPQACKDVCEHLMRRLEHQSPKVKYKTLRVFKYLVESGPPAVQEFCEKNVTVVEEASRYHGVLDPVHHDAYNKKVRDNASELLNMIYDSSFRADKQQSIRTVGFGSDSAGPPAPGASSPHRAPSHQRPAYHSSAEERFVGFGNPNFPEHKPKVKKRSAVSHASVSQPPPQRALSSYYQDHSTVLDFGTSDHTVGRPGGGWDVGGEGDTRRPAVAAPVEPPVEETVNNTAEDVGQDRFEEARAAAVQLVDKVATRGGVKVVPSTEILDEFVRRSRTISGDAICEELEKRLVDPQWQIRLKALYAIHALLAAGVSQCFAYFDVNVSVLRECQSAANSSLRAKASEVVSLIAGASAQPATIAAAPVVKAAVTRSSMRTVSRESSSQQRAVSLLDLDDGAAVPSGEGEASTTSLFGGLTLDAELKERQENELPGDLFSPAAASQESVVGGARNSPLDPNISRTHLGSVGGSPAPVALPEIASAGGQQIVYVMAAPPRQTFRMPQMTAINLQTLTSQKSSDPYPTSLDAAGDSAFDFVDAKNDSFDFVQEAMAKAPRK